MGKLSDLILTNKNENLLSMGYSYNLKDVFAYLDKKERGNLEESSDLSSKNIFGITTSKENDSSINYVFLDEFSIDIKNPLWKVERAFTQSVVLWDESAKMYFLPIFSGEDSHFIAGNFRYKVTPGSFKEDCATAAENALEDRGFLVGCIMDMDYMGVDYLNKFHTLSYGKKWNSSHTNALIQAGCLYAEYICTGVINKSFPMRIIGTMGFKSSIIKITSPITLLDSLKDMKFETHVVCGENSQKVETDSNIEFPCAGSNYDYIKAEISNYNPQSFRSWLGQSKGGKKDRVIQTKQNVYGDTYVKLFIPTSKKEEAEYALAGKDISIPSELYKDSFEFNYVVTDMTSKHVDVNENLISYEGHFGNRIKHKAKKLYEYCKGKVLEDENVMEYSQSKRPKSFKVSTINPYTSYNTSGGIRNKELYDILNITGNSKNHPYTNDCSSFVQMMIYSAVGLKSGIEVVNEILSTQDLIKRGPSVINKYINENYKATLLNYNFSSLQIGDVLVKNGHAALYLGEKYAHGTHGLLGANTMEFHGKNNQNLHGFTKGDSYTHIIRIIKS